MNRPRNNQRYSDNRSSKRTHPNRDALESMNRPRKNQRHSGNRSSNRTHPNRDTSDNNAGREMPQAPIATTPEEEFQQLFGKFFFDCCFSQFKTLIFFLVLMICTQIFGDYLSAALSTYLGLTAIKMLVMGWCLRFAKTNLEKGIFFIKEIKCLSLIFWMLSLGVLPDTLHNTKANIATGSIYIVLYVVNILLEFEENTPRFVKYINQIKKSVALLRLCIILQLVVALIQVNVSTPMTWFAGFFPIYILTFGILYCTIVIIKSIFITNRNLFWDSNTSQKQKTKGIIWILGNLFALQFILLYGTIHASFVIEDGSSSSKERPYLALFIIIIAWCIVSLISIKYTKGGVPEIFRTLAGLSKPARNNGSEEPSIKYVIKVSNTFFKAATEQDIKLLKSQKAQPVVVSDQEANLKRQQTNSGKCLVCCKNDSNGVFMGCGHGGICYECGKDIMSTQKECHMCRTNISSLLKMRIKKKKMFYEVLQELKIKNVLPQVKG